MTLPPDDPKLKAAARVGLRRFLPFQQFAETGTLGSALLLLGMVAALVWANSPWAASYFELWDTKFVVGRGDAPMELSLRHWINDGLMVVFFLYVGLEIKRELIGGELASVRQASLPIVAAIGGMLVPAGIYVLINLDSGALRGWGIPMATDIAFALGVLQLLGPRCPIGLKVFLTALAIIDDMGAILVIALFYSGDLVLPALLWGLAFLGALVALNKMRVRHLAPYLLIGLALWMAVLRSGIHATIAGVLLAFTIPIRTRIKADEFSSIARNLIDEFDRSETGDLQVLSSKGQQEAIHGLESASEAVQAPLLRLEHRARHPSDLRPGQRRRFARGSARSMVQRRWAGCRSRSAVGQADRDHALLVPGGTPRLVGVAAGSDLARGAWCCLVRRHRVHHGTLHRGPRLPGKRAAGRGQAGDPAGFGRRRGRWFRYPAEGISPAATNGR